MNGRKLKKKSKRIPLALKYKVQKKVRDHNRKLKKLKKKNPGKYTRRKDPGVPNILPFKDAIIREAQEARKHEEERREQMRQEKKLRRKEEKQKTFDSNRNISEFLSSAKKRTEEFESKKKEPQQAVLTDKSAKAHSKEFKKVVEAADVVLEVLDARDPEGSRCLPLEDLVNKDSAKRLVFVLNKSDLVPRTSLEAWLKYLRCFHPAVAFKSSTQKQAKNLSHVKAKVTRVQNPRAGCIGADTLLQLLKNYCRNCGIKTAITVGVVGLPNVGKSSLINSLKRSRACHVGATPGITKSMQEVSLDSTVRLLDCPGVILPGANTSDASSSLRNAVRLENIEDPIPLVQAILEKAGDKHLMLHYTLHAFKDVNEFLALYARKRGKMGAKGIPLITEAAKMVIRDWNTGRIKHYTMPPSTSESETKSSAALISTMSKEFSLDEIENTEALALAALPKVLPSDLVRTVAEQPLKSIREEVEPMEEGTPQEQENDTDFHLPENVEVLRDEESTEVQEEKNPEKKPHWETDPKEIDVTKVCLRKLQKTQAKKQRKEKARNERRADELVRAFQGLEGSVGSDPTNTNYDFGEYFNVK